jgi:hypothetical protein
MSGRSRLGTVSGTLATHRMLAVTGLLALTSACTSVGQVGIMTKPGADPGALLTQATAYEQIGPANGEACRYFLLGVAPWGDSTATRAFEKALEPSGGDALINVTVSTSLYGFIPIYNVFSFTCTTVDGVAIRYKQAPAPSGPSSPPS